MSMLKVTLCFPSVMNCRACTKNKEKCQEKENNVGEFKDYKGVTMAELKRTIENDKHQEGYASHRYKAQEEIRELIRIYENKGK